MRPRQCSRGACQRPLFGQSAMCEYHLLEVRSRNRRYYREKKGIPLDAPLKGNGRPREETLLPVSPPPRIPV